MAGYLRQRGKTSWQLTVYIGYDGKARKRVCNQDGLRHQTGGGAGTRQVRHRGGKRRPRCSWSHLGRTGADEVA
jgi:hypothetical protein